MTLKYKHISLLFAGLLVLCSFMATMVTVQPAQAACSPESRSECTDASSCAEQGQGKYVYSGSTLTCVPKDSTDGVEASASVDDPASGGGKCDDLSHCDLIDKYLNPAIQLFSVMVGIVIAISIVIGGIQYASSAGDPQAAAAARRRIRNAVIALLTYLFLYALLNFLVLGGIK